MKIGILGGGQLGRMLALAGYPLGFRFRFFEPSADAPIRYLAEHHRGSYEDEEALARFAEGLDAVTYEFENVPVKAARFLFDRVPVYPSPAALSVSQDRLAEKTFLSETAIETPRFYPVNSLSELEEGIQRTGFPSFLKTRRFGYDGKGQARIETEADLVAAWENLNGVPLLLEEGVAFDRELSVLAVRGRDGEIATYPLVENHHREGILRLSVAPAPRLSGDLQIQADRIVRRILEKLDYVGVVAVELFETNGKLLVNEMAPRVHNSGHWTIDGAETNQFENHLRAIAGLPLGSTEPRGYAAMVNLIGCLPDIDAVLRLPGAHLHLYDKEPRPGRKIGHVNVCAGTVEKRGALVAAVQGLLP